MVRAVRPIALSLLLIVVAVLPAAAKKKKESPVPPVQNEAALIDYLVAQVAPCYDPSRGGFVAKDGVPDADATHLAFVLAQDAADDPWRTRAIGTLDWTVGLRDTVGGGFFHSAKDVALDIPSFHKRTDSNAERLELLLEGYAATGDARYRRQAAEVVDYFHRVLLDGRGGFVAGQVGDRELMPEPNGHAIRAWCAWAVATADPRVRDFALKSADAVWERCWEDGVGMLRRDVFGQPIDTPQLIDQVEMGRAFVSVASISGRDKDRQRAVVLGDLLLNVFANAEKGGFFTKARVDDKGKTNGGGKDSYANSRAARFLAELATLTGEAKYRDAARTTIASFTPEIEKPEFEAAQWALAVRALSTDDRPQVPTWATIVEKERTPPATRRYNTRRR